MLLITVYAVCASTPCPPRAQDEGRANTARVEARDSRASSDEGPVLSAACHCGCGSRPAVLGARVGVAIAARALEPANPVAAREPAVFADFRHLPDPPLRAIDHVPLSSSFSIAS